MKGPEFTTNQSVRPEEVRFKSGPYELFGKLYLRDEKAPTILLLHGLGFHSFEYDTFAPLLTRSRFNCFAFDHRCHGRSDGPRGYWVLQELVEDASNALNYVVQQQHGRIGVFGNSMGALVALHLAARDRRVASLVASGCPTRVADFAVIAPRLALLSVLKALARFFPIRVSVNHFEPYRRILSKPKLIEQVRADRMIADARRFAPSTYSDIFAWNALQVMDEVRAPLLVLHGSKDLLEPVDQAKLLFDAAHCEKEIRIIDTGHLPNLEHADLLNQVVRDWFTKTLS